MAKKRVAIIGAGVAGLACAARLGAKGYEVSVFERNKVVGGKLGLLKDAGFSWDTGPSLFTQPFLLEALFADCGHSLQSQLRYRSIDEGTQYFWQDGTSFHAAPDVRQLSASAQETFGIAPDTLLHYLEDTAGLYHSIASIFLNEPIHRLSTWKLSSLAPALKALKPAYLLKTLHAYNASRLKHPKLVQIMDRLATYNGSDPYQCPAMLSTIAHLEFNEGCWYPDGGMFSIAKALEELCNQMGVTIRLGETVQEVLKHHQTIAGITTAAGELETEAVVSNCDVYFTYRDLLKDQQMASGIKRQERSSSGVVFYWGIRSSFPQLKLHNIFFSDDYEQEFRELFQEKRLPSDPTIYVNISSKQDKSHAPDGCENWFVLINAPSKDHAISSEDVQQLRQRVLAKLGKLLGEDISQLISCEHILTPQDIEIGSGSYLGSLYGTASNNAMAAFNRHPNYSRKYKGLFFAGGTVHPGGGIPLCLRSGKLAAEAVDGYLAS